MTDLPPLADPKSAAGLAPGGGFDGGGVDGLTSLVDLDSRIAVDALAGALRSQQVLDLELVDDPALAMALDARLARSTGRRRSSAQPTRSSRACVFIASP